MAQWLWEDLPHILLHSESSPYKKEDVPPVPSESPPPLGATELVGHYVAWEPVWTQQTAPPGQIWLGEQTYFAKW